jgi:hypothetical protein
MWLIRIVPNRLRMWAAIKGGGAGVAPVDDLDGPVLPNLISDRDGIAAARRIDLQEINFEVVTHRGSDRCRGLHRLANLANSLCQNNLGTSTVPNA